MSGGKELGPNYVQILINKKKNVDTRKAMCFLLANIFFSFMLLSLIILKHTMWCFHWLSVGLLDLLGNG